MNSDAMMEIDEERKSQRNQIQTVRSQFEIQEERKSQVDQDSLKEKQIDSHSSSRPSSVHENVKSNSLNGTNRLNGLNVGLNRIFETQN